MRRYEFKEGTSNKFWEIELEGESFTTRFGKIGTEGQTSTKEFDGTAEARKAYDKIIAEKEKKGYVLVADGSGGGAGGAPAKKASNPDLEKAILENLDDPAPYLVYGDWLTEQGDPRGELIALQAAVAKSHGDAKLQEKVDQYIEAHKTALLGELMDIDGADEDLTVTWRYGFLDGVSIGNDEYSEIDAEGVCRTLFKLPSAKFLRNLTFLAFGTEDGEPDYGPTMKAAAKAGPPKTIRELVVDIGSFQISWAHLGDIGPLLAQLPNLETLRIKIGHMTLGDLALPNLRTFEVVTGGFTKENMKSVAKATWPKLETLTLYFGDDNYGADCDVGDIQPVLDGKGIPNVKHLALANSQFADDIAAALPKSKVLKQLATLDLSKGTMSDAGATALIENAAAFAHLEKLDLTENFISTEVAEKLTKAFGNVKVEIDDQNESEDDYRYVQVAE